MQRSTIVAGAAAAHDQSVFCVYIYNAHTTYIQRTYNNLQWQAV